MKEIWQYNNKMLYGTMYIRGAALDGRFYVGRMQLVGYKKTECELFDLFIRQIVDSRLQFVSCML